MSLYHHIIARILRDAGRPDVSPAHAEAFMRSSNQGILDDLTLPEFRREVLAAVACVDEIGLDGAEDIARSWGLGCPAKEASP